MSQFRTLPESALRQLEMAAIGHVFDAHTGENLTIKNANIPSVPPAFTGATGGEGPEGPYTDHVLPYGEGAEVTPMDVDAGATILAIDYGKQIYKKAQNKATFLDFLRAQGSVSSTNSALHLVPSINDVESGFIREDGSDVMHAEVGVGSPKYRCASIGLEYDYTDMFGNAAKVPLAQARTALDIENMFYLANVEFMDKVLTGEVAGKDFQFDGLQKATGTPSTLDVYGLETAVETIADAGANPDFILANRKSAKILANSGDIEDFVDVKSDGKRVIGKSVTAFDSGDGLIPIIVDNNMTEEKAYIGDSSNFDIRILADGIRVPQGKRFLIESIIFYTSAMSALVNTDAFVELTPDNSS